MSLRDKDVDITKNIKMIEWLKSELLTAVALLFETLARGIKNSQEIVLDAIANIILVTYLLGRRLGLSLESIDSKIKDKAKLGRIEEHNIEKWYGDLSELLNHLNKRN